MFLLPLRPRFSPLLLCIAFLAAAPLHAQETDTVLRSMLQQTLQTHPQIRAARAKLDGSRFGLSAAQWGRYPSFSATASRNDAGDSVRQLAAQQPLWAGGRIDADIAANESKVSGATASVQEAEFQLSEQVLLAAVELQRYRVLQQRAEESLAAYEKLLAAIHRRSEGGLGLQSDAILARSRVEQAKALSAQYAATARRAYTRWMSLTGLEPAALQVSESPNGALAPLKELIEAAKAYSPALVRLRAEAVTAGYEADVTQAAQWPQLSLRATYTTAVTDSKQVMAVLEYQPGAGLGVLDRARAAYSARDAALAQIDKVTRDVEEQVSGAHADLQGFAARAQALAAAAEANAEVIDSFIRQYNIGKRTWLDVMNAQREWAESRIQSEETRFNAIAAAYKLAIYSGRYFQ